MKLAVEIIVCIVLNVIADCSLRWNPIFDVFLDVFLLTVLEVLFHALRRKNR